MNLPTTERQERNRRQAKNSFFTENRTQRRVCEKKKRRGSKNPRRDPSNRGVTVERAHRLQRMEKSDMWRKYAKLLTPDLPFYLRRAGEHQKEVARKRLVDPYKIEFESIFPVEMSTARDKAILNSILNPFFPVGGDFDTEDPQNLQDVIDEVTDDVLEAKRIEKEAIVMAENGKVVEAIEALSKAIELAPQLPSLYNNRAQAYRLNGDTEGAFEDLNRAINISKGCGRSACQAFCQRGLIYKKNDEREKAMEDFKRAAELGSPFAKMVLVQSNPYAALCNEMLSQVMEKLAKGQYESN